MADPIDPTARSIPSSLEGPTLAGSSPAGRATPGAEFRDALRADPAAPAAPAAPALLRDAALRIARGELRIDQVIRQCQRGGGTLTNEQLIALQTTVYRYTQEVELAAKLVDKLTGAVKQTLSSQQ